MDLDTKKNYVEIVNNQGNLCNIDCLGKLKAKCKLTNSYLVYLQPCILLSMEETSNIDRGLEYVTIEEGT